MLHVVDARSNVKDNIVNAAEVLGKSRWRQDIFREIYRGKPKPKTAEALAKTLRRPLRRVLTIGNELRKAGLVEQSKVDGRVAYTKEGFLDQHKKRILRLASDPKARNAVPTKVRPAAATSSTVRLKIWGKPVQVTQVTVDDIASFAKVRKVKAVPAKRLALSEEAFKEGIKKIIGEPGTFVDSPGERFDVLSTRVKLKGSRISTAFAFKGPGKRGILKPFDLGRNGDQIQRLFHSEAALFIVQYWDQVDEGIFELMRTFSVARSVYLGERVYYGVIDGRDSDRLVLAYPTAFEHQARKGGARGR